MSTVLTLNARDFELPEQAKVATVFDRLMKINAAVTQNGLHEVYSERHDRYEESYGIAFF